jgi:high-affinity nickel-transport protein
MNTDLLAPSGLLLMFVLGLRHGLDPDHIACIDSLTWRALGHSHPHAGWVGTLFAVGHGLVVTGIAVLVGRVAPGVTLPAALVRFFDWVPTGLLVLVGVLNLRLLLRPDGVYAPTGWRSALIPRTLRGRGAWSVVVIGVLFATVFDTATQAAAWGYVASSKDGGAWHALVAGLTFTAGMVLTDTVDGRIVCRIGRSLNGPAAAQKVRRVLGALVVAISFGVALYNIAKALLPGIELGDLAFSLVGGALVVLMLALSVWSNRLRVRST